MTLTVPQRLNDVMLTDIARRLSSPMNDDGLRAWYRQDGGALLEEVIALRRERAAVLASFARNPALQDYPHHGDPADLANRLLEVWTEQQQGVWQRAEVKRIRDKLAATTHSLQALEQSSEDQARTIGELKEQVEQMQAQLLDAIADGRRAVDDANRACAERSQRVAMLINQAKEILE